MLVVTSSFPAGSAEGFLEDELKALRFHVDQLLVVPLWPRGSVRSLESMQRAGLTFRVAPLSSVRMFLDLAGALRSQPLKVLYWLSYLLVKGRTLRIRLKNVAILPKAVWLSRIVRETNTSHVHAHWAATTATLAMVAADFAGITWSLTAHRWDIYERNIPSTKSARCQFVRFISYKGLLDGVRLGFSKKKCVVVHMGVREFPDTVKDTYAGSPFRIVVAANLIPVKGHVHLIRAMRLLSDTNVDIMLDVIGSGPLRGELEAYVQQLGLSSSIEFLGQLPHDELLDRYRSGIYGAFVLPSVDLGGGLHEGIPVSLMEAIAHGIPALATQTGSIEELLPRHIGATVKPASAEELAEWLSKIATDRSFWRLQLGEQHKIVREWTSEAAARKLAALITSGL